MSLLRHAALRDVAAVACAGVLIYASAFLFDRFKQIANTPGLYDADVVSAAIGIVVAAGLALALYWLRRVRQLRNTLAERRQGERYTTEQAARLSTVFNNIPQGILMFDADKRLVVCNDHYLQMYNLSADVVKPGVDLLDIFRHRVANSGLNRSAEEYYADSLHRFDSHEVVRRLVKTEEGREIAVSDYPIPGGGGWVVTHEDRTELRRRDESFRLLFDNNPMPMWLFDRDTLRFLAINDATLEAYGYSREQFLSMKVSELRIEEPAEAEADIRALPDVQDDHAVIIHHRANGEIFPVSICSRIMSYGGRQVRLAVVKDISAQKLAENDLRRTKKFLDTVFENVPVPIVVKTAADGRFMLINKASEELHGYRREETIGKNIHEVFDEPRAASIAAQDVECLTSEKRVSTCDHTVMTHKGERLITTKKVAIPGDDGEPEYILTLIDDVTDKRRAEQRIAHMAHSDPLTDLPNRAAFNQRLAATLQRSAGEDRTFALLCMDLDGFKGINDIYGHAVGDALLCQIADRLREVAGDCFTARLGGDEFTMIASDLSAESLQHLTDRLRAAFTTDFEIGEHHLPQALSVGVAVYPTDGADAKTLLSNADAALYRAKAAGSGSVSFYKSEMATRLRERAALQADLKAAIQNNELRLHYQPLLRLTGEIIGFEALTRWQCPKRGMVPPSEFIPLAEESSLILLLGEWVLREACREAASWQRPLNIAINVSPVQFRHGDLPRLVHSILLETGLSPNRLELEITEGVLIDDFSRAVSILRRLKALGVRIALDDFGTGYSSLSYLRGFPFDKIKIDRSFISDLDTNHHSLAIVHAVIGLGRSLNIPTLAEGVETKAQHDILRDEGCDEVQGYLTGRPREIADYASAVGRTVTAVHAKAS